MPQPALVGSVPIPVAEDTCLTHPADRYCIQDGEVLYFYKLGDAAAALLWHQSLPHYVATVGLGGLFTSRVIRTTDPDYLGSGGVALELTIDTERTSVGSSAADKFALPLVNGGAYNCTVYWGDGLFDTITAWNDAAATHTYAAAGIYAVTIVGQCEGWAFNSTGDRLKVLDLSSWGDGFKVGNFGAAFKGCTNMSVSAHDALNLAGGLTLIELFRDCPSILAIPGIGTWDTSNLLNTASMFNGCAKFNQALATLDMGSVLNTSFMLQACALFNQPLDSWDVSACVQFNGMLSNCPAFNRPLNSWNLAAATEFGSMFSGCSTFNQDLNSWDMSKVILANYMFRDCLVFNGNIDAWDMGECLNMSNMFNNARAFTRTLAWNVAKCTDFSQMFLGAILFNHGLEGWDVGAGVNFQAMFQGATLFNRNISGWDMSNAVNLRDMFNAAAAFNQPIGPWNVSKVTSFFQCFFGAVNFNADISGWNTGAATHMGTMFRSCSAFNQPIGAWNMVNVTNIGTMLQSCISFKQSLGNWDLRSVTNAVQFAAGCDINSPNSATSQANYNNTLTGITGWAAGAPGAKGLALQSGVAIHFGTSKYKAGTDAAAARAWLIATKGWAITDGGAVP